ncbi:faciogenital dysplasia protein [Anaeramoeba flamelloides]|uniref:Faciogenital dysplasia protein n=1 Tax=Anaeramoeba flamelloides TaxID=1746091 RepID=A0ABQ8XCI1_9EUKA|nr:faciogenital dysplasia protein [Anaeramoeba flamelloides]
MTNDCSSDVNLIVQIQSEFRRHIMKKPLDRLRKKATLRMKTLQEMLTTEETYSGRLSMCVDLFAKPLFQSITHEKKSQRFVDQKEFKTIFQNIEELADYHSNKILVSLRERLGHLINQTKSHDQKQEKESKSKNYKESEKLGENEDEYKDTQENTKKEDQLENKQEVEEEVSGGNKERENEKEEESKKETGEDQNKQYNKEEQEKEKEKEKEKELDKGKEKDKEKEKDKKKEDVVATYQELVHNTRLGKCFQGFKVIVNLYQNYCEGYDEGLKLLAHLRSKKEKFSSWLLEVKHTPEALNLDITSYLIMPIQRLPRYKLLLSEALKHTDPLHPDYVPTKEAIGFIENIAQRINDHLNVLESQRELYELQSNVIGWDVVKPNRKLLLDLPVNKVNPYGSIQKRHLFLFSDVIIWASKSLGKYRMKKFINTDTSWIQEMPPFPKFPNMFLIVGKKQTVTICALAEEDKLSFFESFRDFIGLRIQSNPKLLKQRVNAKLRKKIINQLAMNLSMYQILKKLSPPKVGTVSGISVFGESIFQLKVQSNTTFTSDYSWDSQKTLKSNTGISSKNFNFKDYSNKEKKTKHGISKNKLSKFHYSHNLMQRGHLSRKLDFLNELRKGKNLPPPIPKKLDEIEKLKRMKKIRKLMKMKMKTKTKTKTRIRERKNGNGNEDGNKNKNQNENENENENKNKNENGNGNGSGEKSNEEIKESQNKNQKTIVNKSKPPPLPKKLNNDVKLKRLKKILKNKENGSGVQNGNKNTVTIKKFQNNNQKGRK